VAAADPGENAPSFSGGLEMRSALADALRRLSERDREILLLAAWEGLDRTGLAAALGCTKTAAGVRLYRARKRLATALSVVEADVEGIPAAQGGVVDGF
jgi:RNA polymerase sigma-70 factor, ECF subfamily